MLTFTSGDFIAKPFNLTYTNLDELAQAAFKSSMVLSRLAAHPTFFSDYERGCAGKCAGFCTNKTQKCEIIKKAIIKTLQLPDTLVWEVHKQTAEALDFVGILRLSRITVGCDATCHYFFFDGKLNDKTDLLKEWKTWAFGDHEGWPALHRITIQIPSDAFALARHAQKHLGFGGQFSHTYKGNTISVEGVTTDAVLRNGQWLDVLQLGCING